MLVRDFHKDLILPVPRYVFVGACDDEYRVCIGDTSFQNYIPKNINTTRSRNNIVYGCEICIISVLIQCDLKEIWLR